MHDFAWIFNREKLSRAIYENYKRRPVFHEVIHKIHTNFPDDPEAIEFILRDRPDWACDGVGHYLEWLRVTQIFYIMEWAYYSMGRCASN